jgi:hypothetical protein
LGDFCIISGEMINDLIHTSEISKSDLQQIEDKTEDLVVDSNGKIDTNVGSVRENYDQFTLFKMGDFSIFDGMICLKFFYFRNRRINLSFS